MEVATSIYEQFDKVSRDFAEKPALIYLGTRYTFSQLRDVTESLAGHLYSMGVSRGDKAVLYLPNCLQWVIGWLALQRIGAVAVPISPSIRPSTSNTW